jgi:TorA maturation chaperone TorD
MFKFNNKKKQPTEMAEMAGARETLYDLLVKIINHLPDEDFLSKIENRLFEEVFEGFSGVEYIKSYRSRMDGKSPDAIITELAVDRTKILRGTGHKELKPPHEGCYKKESDIGSAAIKVRSFYRKAGMLPDESIPESPDYLCVELDFMKNLCLREKEQWLSGEEASETLALEKGFLTEHLGCWMGDFCSVTKKHAMTDFYRGFCEILDEVIRMDLEYLKAFPEN